MRLGLFGGCLGPVAAAAVALAGCSGGNLAPPPPTDGASSDRTVPPPRQLVLESEPVVGLGFGESTNFTVRLTEEDGSPVTGGTVHFVLTGDAHDSSLGAVEGITDSDGRVTGNLVAGSAPSAFRIRITADRAPDLFIDVSVSDQGFGDLLVTVMGEVDEREVDQRWVGVFVDASCDEPSLRTIDGDRALLLEPGETAATFDSLPAGLPVAAAVRLEGPEGTLVGWGCAETTIAADEQTEVTVQPQALPLEPAGIYDARLSLDTTAAAETAAQGLADAGGAVIASHGGEGALLLDAIEEELGENGPAALLEQFKSVRSGGTLEEDLETDLDADGVGPAVAVGEASQGVDFVLREVTVRGPLTVDPEATEQLAWQLDEISVAVGSDPDEPLTVAATTLDPDAAAVVSGTFRPAGDALEIDLLEVTLPLGQLAVHLLEAATMRENRDSLADWIVADGDTRIGCNTFEEWLRSSTVASTCDADCAHASCMRAAQELAGGLRSASAGLDAERDTLRFDTDPPLAVPLQDADGDLVVEGFGVAGLTGEWSPPSAADGDPVSGGLDASRTGDLP